MVMGKRYNQLRLEEREQIMVLRVQGMSVREIGSVLGRSHSTVVRELSRNRVSVGFTDYLAHQAEWRARRRKQEAGRRERLKKPSWLRSSVREKLLAEWSPELISGYLRLEEGRKVVSSETIYQYVYGEARELIPFLARGHRRRRSRWSRRTRQRSRIADRVGIEERPSAVNDRREFGHWESDSMVSRSSKAALNVLVERKSRYANLTKLSGKTSIHTRRALVDRLSVYPQEAQRSITYDNGSENVEHTAVNVELGTRSYFCNPYRSWEKGSVENVAGLVRRTIPKKTDFRKITDGELQEIEWELNHRPRKVLGFRTPAEVFDKLVGALPP